jgi:hypothetical protein
MGTRRPPRDKEVDVRKRLLTTLLLITLALLLLPAAAQAMNFDQAVNKLVANGWAKKMENKVVGFKGNALGYRSGGTAADDACARWIAGEFRAIGLPTTRSTTRQDSSTGRSWATSPSSSSVSPGSSTAACCRTRSARALTTL